MQRTYTFTDVVLNNLFQKFCELNGYNAQDQINNDHVFKEFLDAISNPKNKLQVKHELPYFNWIQYEKYDESNIFNAKTVTDEAGNFIDLQPLCPDQQGLFDRMPDHDPYYFKTLWTLFGWLLNSDYMVTDAAHFREFLAVDQEMDAVEGFIGQSDSRVAEALDLAEKIVDFDLSFL